jgi:hypothetical protein
MGQSQHPQLRNQLRIGLGLLAFEAAMIGVQALFFPRYFYTDFLLGRGWVEMNGPYSAHLIVDLGALYIGFFVVLTYATAKLSRDLINASTVAFMVATTPHMIYHWANAHVAHELIDKVLQVGLLAMTLFIGAGVLWMSRVYFSGQRVEVADSGRSSRQTASID